MKLYTLNLLVISLVLTLCVAQIRNANAFPQSQTSTQSNKNYRFINGNWFDGKKFEKKTFYSVDGVFSNREPKQVAETVDLANAYVVPPFGEAHNHNVESSYTLERIMKQYLIDGIFYVKNPNSIPRLTQQIQEKINTPDSIDVVFANGGLTAKGGHPVSLYEALSKSAYRSSGITDFENQAYYFIDSVQDLETKWAQILAGKPDFIKTYLLHSEEYEKRRDDEKFYGLKGLNPKLLPLIVEKAHGAGLRVSTHVNTATDFHYAVVAGVDEINHLPGRLAPEDGNFERYIVSEADSKLAAKKNIFVVPTYILLLTRKNKDESSVEKVKDVQRKNLRLLHKSGVRIAFGTDSYGSNSQTEALHLKDLGVFDSLTLLKMWTEITPQTIFPDRKIGRLKEGYEASFIVLAGNPLGNFEQVKNIKLRFKQGRFINIGEKES